MDEAKEIKQIGIIGQGAFGRFLLGAIPKDCKVLVYDKNVVNQDDGSPKTVSLDKVVDVDVLILAVPLASYEDLLPQVNGLIKPDTLVIDICSVKTYPNNLIKKLLKNHKNILMTHPLFGPQSATEGLSGHTLIVTDIIGVRAKKVIEYCESVLELQVMEMSVEQHDRTMAQVHVLTFFTARGLGAMNLPPVEFQTPSYNEILDLIALDNTHTEDLFRTIQLGNPYAEEVREQFISSLSRVHEELKKND